jgi:predicted nuclease of predicted toxin-antitoxin system
MIALLLDAGLPRSAAGDLRAVGWDVLHVSDVGLAAANDSAILDFARSHERVVVTLDGDFPRLMYVGAYASPSVVLLRLEGLDRASTVEILKRLVPAIEDRLRAGAVVSVDGKTARVRTLPIR